MRPLIRCFPALLRFPEQGQRAVFEVAASRLDIGDLLDRGHVWLRDVFEGSRAVSIDEVRIAQPL